MSMLRPPGRVARRPEALPTAACRTRRLLQPVLAKNPVFLGTSTSRSAIFLLGSLVATEKPSRSRSIKFVRVAASYLVGARGSVRPAWYH
jgi:hypothetical protein